MEYIWPGIALVLQMNWEGLVGKVLTRVVLIGLQGTVELQSTWEAKSTTLECALYLGEASELCFEESI